MPLSAEIVTDAAQLAGLEPEWWALWDCSPAATPFQSPAWLLAWWRQFAPGDLRTIAVWDDDRLVGLAPFYLEQGSQGARLLPVGISLSDYLDVLVDPHCEDDAAARIVEQALQIPWHSWEFEELGPEARAWTLPCPAGLAETEARQSACPLIALGGGADLTGCVPARRRRQLRRAHASARRRGRSEIICDVEPHGFLDHLFRLHAKRWQSNGEAGVLADRKVQDVHRQSLPDLAARGIARCYLIRIGEEIAAAYYGFVHARRAYAYLGGFDPTFSEESPGSMLIGHAIAEALREGAAEFDFLRGQEAYKYSWGAADRWNRQRSFRRNAIR